jgi:hypothetical protein
MSAPAAEKGRRIKRFLRGTLVAAIIVGAAGAAVFGFIECREERLGEAERGRPVQPPIRVSTENGMATVRLDAATVQRSGIETAN